MAYFLKFAHGILLFGTIPLVCACLFMRWRYYKPMLYRYTLGSLLKKNNLVAYIPYKKIIAGARIITFLLLALLIGKPQIVDEKSQVIVDGIDIMLALDASGSMDLSYGLDDKRTRFVVAKQEAIRFIEKRSNDAVGLVIFGKDAITRAPLTLDKPMLKSMIDEVQLGDVDPQGTVLATAMVTALNRLRCAQAKSKIIILLTDGDPTPEDSDPAAALAIAKKMGVKVYTIGIGTTHEGIYMDPRYGLVSNHPVNQALLRVLAQETGGQFFMAHNAQDMRAVYDTIDQLEKTEHQAPLFSHYYDIFVPFIVCILILLFFELCMTAWLWFGI